MHDRLFLRMCMQLFSGVAFSRASGAAACAPPIARSVISYVNGLARQVAVVKCLLQASKRAMGAL